MKLINIQIVFWIFYPDALLLKKLFSLFTISLYSSSNALFFSIIRFYYMLESSYSCSIWYIAQFNCCILQPIGTFYFLANTFPKSLCILARSYCYSPYRKMPTAPYLYVSTICYIIICHVIVDHFKNIFLIFTVFYIYIYGLRLCLLSYTFPLLR